MATNRATTGTSGRIVDVSHGQTIAYDASFKQLRQSVPFADVTISTTLPRGGLQIVQPRQTDPNRLRLYTRERHLDDIVAWRAMASGSPCRVSDLAADSSRRAAGVAERFARDFLQPFGLTRYVAVPLESPVLEGFPGVLQLFRTNDAGDFSSAELRQLTQAAGELDDAARALRKQRRVNDFCTPMSHQLTCRQLVIREGRQVLFPRDGALELDEVLRSNLLDRVERVLASRKGGNGRGSDAGRARTASTAAAGDRLLVPDRLGDAWPFRLVMFDSYPAAADGYDGSLAVVSLQPDCDSWAELHPSDFQADDEIARLIPAIHYMHANFTRRSSLTEIARTVHLSPFHFHRRFTELLGITPKHYLFDCQISEAKNKLAEQELDLADIARHCGFAHQSHFTSRFKQATGLTPTKWRRLAKQVRELSESNETQPVGA